MDSFLYIWVLPIIGGLIWYAITSSAVRAPGAVLASKFAKVQNENGGKLVGIPFARIVAVCGNPSAVSSMPEGKKLRQWQATSYHIALIFDENDICLGVSSEISV